MQASNQTQATLSLPVLRNGSRGDDVRYLQDLLNHFGYHLVVDGIFGSRTEAAVREFQRSYNLSVDGIVGSQTWSTLLYQFHD